MPTRKIKKSIDIETSPENVWKALLTRESYKIWAAEFSGSADVKTDWKVGSVAHFTDDSNSGLVGKIIANVPHEIISIEYLGEVVDGKEVYESKMANEIKGGIETYKLTETDSGTHLDIELDMAEQYFDMMSEAWDRALAKVKHIAESL